MKDKLLFIAGILLIILTIPVWFTAVYYYIGMIVFDLIKKGIDGNVHENES